MRAASLEEQFAVDDPIRARLLQTMADTLGEVGPLDAAAAPQTETLEIAAASSGTTTPKRWMEDLSFRRSESRPR